MLPALRYQVEIRRYERGVETVALEPSGLVHQRQGRYGTLSRTWYRVDGGKIVQWADETPLPPGLLGEPIETQVTRLGAVPAREARRSKRNTNGLVDPCAEFLTARAVLDRPVQKIPATVRNAAAKWARIVQADGVASSVNQWWLATVCGYELGVDGIDRAFIEAALAEDLACLWFRLGCGVANEQLVNRTHGALNVAPRLRLAQLGFEAAVDGLIQAFAFVRAVDPFETGQAIACGARSARGKDDREGPSSQSDGSADFGDPAARALRGDRLKLSKRPSVHDSVFVIQRDFPEVVERGRELVAA